MRSQPDALSDRPPERVTQEPGGRRLWRPDANAGFSPYNVRGDADNEALPAPGTSWGRALETQADIQLTLCPSRPDISRPPLEVSPRGALLAERVEYATYQFFIYRPPGLWINETVPIATFCLSTRVRQGRVPLFSTGRRGSFPRLIGRSLSTIRSLDG